MVPNLIAMLDLDHDAQLEELLVRADSINVVLDYVPRISRDPLASTYGQHRQAAITAMQVIDRAFEKWAADRASEEIPIDRLFRLAFDESKLNGKRIAFEEFWGNDDITPEQLSPTAWALPNIDGYKTAFFHPPHGIHGKQTDNEDLFHSINAKILGSSPESCTFYSWSTDWSNYFDAGHEWWGAFFWTVYSPETKLLTAIGASTSD